MRLIFMGTPDFALVTLKALIAAGHHIICVYCQPPRPAGRGLALKPAAVHAYAQAQGIALRCPMDLKSADEQRRFAQYKSEAAVVVAYGLLLPAPILEAPHYGCFNIHASLLPRWRGAAPVQRAIMAGDAQTGVSIMHMQEGLDTGPVMKMQAMPIHAQTTAGQLHDELAALGARLMLDTLQNPSAAGMPQAAEGITYARKIDKAETHIDFSLPAEQLRRHIHGLSPAPGAWCMAGQARLKLLQVEIVNAQGPAGTALDDRLTIACGQQALRIIALQRPGKGPMESGTFLRGFPVPAGTRFT